MVTDNTQRNGTPLIEVRDLKKYFPIRRGVFSRVRGHVKAVDDVSFRIGDGKTLGLVGESGCGKTTVGRTILRLLLPTAGDVLYAGQTIMPLWGKALRAMRRNMQIIFQDPYGSLNPRMTVGGIIGEPLTIHGVSRGQERRERVLDLLKKVGLDAAHYHRYPHEFSGGQRQRIGIARALALNPRFIVCDEPVSALDVSIQAQIINLLEDIQAEFNISYLFISHDLRVVEHISDEVAVMYLGRLVEYAPSDLIYKNPLHPYTQVLLSAIPSGDPSVHRQPLSLEEAVAAMDKPSCPFRVRCKHGKVQCESEIPVLKEVEPGHKVACFLH